MRRRARTILALSAPLAAALLLSLPALAQTQTSAPPPAKASVPSSRPWTPTVTDA